jgi:hypothetical protein
MVEQAEILEDHAHAAAQSRELILRDLRHILAEERDETAGGLHREQDEPQQGRLARAGGTGEELERVRLDRRSEVAQNLRAHAIAHAHVLEVDGAGAAVSKSLS